VVPTKKALNCPVEQVSSTQKVVATLIYCYIIKSGMKPTSYSTDEQRESTVLLNELLKRHSLLIIVL